ncbi:hypothetical protein M3Y94_00959000 [Aphelenchoides besseyi]|nr:hypothetical protein M3Y94_00959000 [Aphelenchoides besseyi]
MKRKPKDPIIIPTTTSTTGSQVATTTSVTTSNGPITPIRTAPPPPTDKVDETENQQRRLVHQGAAHFTTDIPQPDDFVPIHTVEPSSCVVAPSDAAFLEQTFGSRLAESSTLGSQLPSADHAVHEVTDDDQTTPRLKRSPAMIIPTDKPITTTADHFQYPTTSTSAVRYVDEDALLQSAGISEMGRRKLPSLPANHSTSLAQQLQDHQPATSTPTTSSLLHYHQMRSNAPIYYTHAPEQKDALIQHSQQSSGVSTGNVSFSNVYFDSKNTAASRLVDHRLRSVEFDTRVAPPTSSVATSTHPVDPAIIPGAQFRSAPVQTASSGPRLISSSSTQRSNVVQPSKISDTIAQLLFKQELRQALSRRRFAQETTEIEANHREFVIRRMLTSGLIPAELRREIDAQPDVVHCELPYELIAGARIVPPGRDLRRSRFYGSSYSASASTRTSPQRLKSPLHFPRYTTQTDELRSDYPTAVGSWSSPTKKSVGCQSEPERSVRIEEPRYGTNAIYTTDRFASDLFAEERASSLRRPFDQSYAQTSPRYGHPTTTPIQRRPLAVDSATQTLVASETQTDGFLESADVHHSSLGRQSKRIPKPTNVQADYSGSIGDYTQQRNAYAATDDLLEATRSYFEEYDRRLRDGTDAYARSRLAQPSISNSLPASTWNLPSGSEETAAEMEWKRRQVAAELERRKARVASLIDLRNSTANWNGDWRKTRVRERPYDGVYGSLPRGYTNERDQWDTQIYAQRGRAQPYGSLPRDFERWMDVEGAEELYRPSRFGTRRYGARIDDYGRRAQPTEDTTLLSDYANYVNAQINAAGFLDDPTQLESTPARQRPAYLADDPTVYRPPTSRYDTMDDNYSIRRPTQSILRSHAPFVGSADDVYTTTRYPPGTTMTRPRYGAGPMTLQKQSPSADFVYSRREANYGARPVQPIGDYGNYELRRAMDYANRNPVGVDPWQQPTAYQTPTGYQQSVGYQQPTNYPSTQLPSNLTYGTYTPAYRTPRQPVNTMPLNGNWDVRWPTTQPTYPPRMPSYTCSTQPRPQPQPYYQLSPQNYQPVSVLNTASLGRNEKRTTGILSTPRSHKHQRNGQSMQNLTANRRSPQQNGHHVHSRSRNGTKIKRLLLTRLYRHANVYHDLGFRVTGGKRLSNGDLGAFITAVNRSRPYDTLGEVKEGDQVLEWNGVLLRGKTFEEVERIIDATSGEIEIVVKSGENKSHKLRHSMNENIYDLTTDETKNFSPREAPPVPAHRKSISRSYVDQEDISRKQRLHYQVHAQNDNYGQLQLALGYDQLNGVLLVTVISAQGLRCREYNNSIVLPNPFVKIYLLPGRKVVNKRRTKYVSNTLNPEWHQTVDYLVSYDELPSHYLELTVWDYDKYNDNICLGQLTLYIDVSMLDNVPRFYELQPADKMLFTAQGVPSNAPYTKPRTITNSNYFYNPANLDLGYPAI